MHILSFTSITLVAFSGMLVAAGPIKGARDNHNTCDSQKPFTGEMGCTPCKSVNNVVCGTFNKRTTDLVCSSKAGNQWVPVNNPKVCGESKYVGSVGSKPAPKPAPLVEGCKSGKPFVREAGCSKCGTIGNIICGQDESRITDLICTSFGNTLSWVPIDDPGKCGVFTPANSMSTPAPKVSEGCASAKPFQAKESCSPCATVGNVICGQDKDRQTDLKCTSVGNTKIWIPVDTPMKKCSA